MKPTTFINACILVCASQYCQAEPLFPLEPGLFWEYEVSGSKPEKVVNGIANSITINDITWYIMFEYDEIFIIRNGELGQMEAAPLFDKDGKSTGKHREFLVFKYPVTIGESYLSNDQKVTVEKKHTVSTPAGSFECIVYNIDLGNGDYSRSCIKVGVGIIINEFMSDNKLIISRLKRFGLLEPKDKKTPAR